MTTDLNKILDNIDSAAGRNDALRAYIYALRDLQRLHDRHAVDSSVDDQTFKRAQIAVERAFVHLMMAQFALNETMR